MSTRAARRNPARGSPLARPRSAGRLAPTYGARDSILKNSRAMPTLKLLLTITAAIAIVFGLWFLTLPEVTVAPFGTALDPAGALIARLYGAMHVGLGLIDWLGRDLREAAARRAVAAGNAAYFALAAVVSVAAVALGTTNALMLLNAAAFALLGLAFARHVVRSGQTLSAPRRSGSSAVSDWQTRVPRADTQPMTSR